MGGIFPTKYKIDNDDGWILDISFNGNETSSIDNAEKLNSQIQSSLDGVLGLKANVVPLDFIFSTNLIEWSMCNLQFPLFLVLIKSAFNNQKVYNNLKGRQKFFSTPTIVLY